MKVKSEIEGAQSGVTLRDPMDCSLPGSSIHGIFQARTLEWGAFSCIIIQGEETKGHMLGVYCGQLVKEDTTQK